MFDQSKLKSMDVFGEKTTRGEMHSSILHWFVRGLCLTILLAPALAHSNPYLAKPGEAPVTVYVSTCAVTGGFIHLYIALDQKLFEKYGINVKHVVIRGGTNVNLAALGTDEVQFLYCAADSTIPGMATGRDATLIASPLVGLPYLIIARKEIRTVQDLKGKIIGISQIGGRAGEIARMVIKNGGLDPDRDVTYLAVGGTMSRLAALSGGRVHAAPISRGVMPMAEEKGLKVLEVEPIPLIIDALWTTRKYAEDNPDVIGRVAKAYVAGIAAIVKDKQKALDVLRKYMRTADFKTLDSSYEVYVKGLDKVPIPDDKAFQNTLEITYRVAPKLAGIDIKKHLYFAPVQRLKEEGYIDRLYK